MPFDDDRSFEEFQLRDDRETERQEHFDRTFARVSGASKLLLFKDSQYLWALFEYDHGDLHVTVGVDTR
jgi:hypothetical protein